MPAKLPIVFGLLVVVSASVAVADLCDAGGAGNDTCISAKDGFCDEVSLCGEGTDCTDCRSGRRRISARLLQPLKHDMLEGQSRRWWRWTRRLTPYRSAPRRTSESRGDLEDRLEDWVDDCDRDVEGEFKTKLMISSIAAALIGAILVLVISLPVCCGVGKSFGKVIGLVVLFSGLFIMFVPMIAASSACSGLINDICKCLPCGDEARSTEKDVCFKQYLYGYSADGDSFPGLLPGCFAVIFGIVSASMSFCAFCNCCAMGKDKPNTVTPVCVGQSVIGQPVSNLGTGPGQTAITIGQPVSNWVIEPGEPGRDNAASPAASTGQHAEAARRTEQRVAELEKEVKILKLEEKIQMLRDQLPDSEAYMRLQGHDNEAILAAHTGQHAEAARGIEQEVAALEKEVKILKLEEERRMLRDRGDRSDAAAYGRLQGQPVINQPFIQPGLPGEVRPPAPANIRARAPTSPPVPLMQSAEVALVSAMEDEGCSSWCGFLTGCCTILIASVAIAVVFAKIVRSSTY